MNSNDSSLADRYHTLIIGAGSGGLTVAVGLSALGKKTAVIEAAQVGGDCTNVGRIPSRTLIHLVNSVNTSGLSAADILKEVQRKRNALRDEETEAFGKLANLDLIAGYARSLGPHTAEVTRADGSKSVYRAKNVVLATGAKPLLIPVPSLPAARQLTNLSMF